MAEETRRSSTTSSISISKVNCLAAGVFTTGCLGLVVISILMFLPYMKPAFQPPAWIAYFENGMSMMCSALFVVGGILGVVCIANTHLRQSGEITSEERSQSERDTGEIEKDNSEYEKITITRTYSSNKSKSEDSIAKHPDLLNVDGSSGLTIFQRLSFQSYDVWQSCIHELGFAISMIFLCSSTIFLGASIAANISVAERKEIATRIRYPQLVGAIGFAVGSAMIMIHAQQKHTTWWQPAWRSLRWQVGLGNLIGSLGFIVCACFGLVSNDVTFAKYHFGMSYLWGSFAFLAASVVHGYRCLRKHAIEKRKEVKDSETG